MNVVFVCCLCKTERERESESERRGLGSSGLMTQPSCDSGLMRVCRNHNEIGTVDVESFGHNHVTDLEVLDLGHNRIRRLSNGSLTGALSTLQHLYVSMIVCYTATGRPAGRSD